MADVTGSSTAASLTKFSNRGEQTAESGNRTAVFILELSQAALPEYAGDRRRRFSTEPGSTLSN
jgi:hypothetical protein